MQALGKLSNPYQQTKYCMRARQLAVVHASGLELRHDGQPLPDMNPALITTVLETQDASKRDAMSDTLQAVMKPLVRAGVISLGQLIHPHGTYLISGRTLKKELGKRCKAPQVAALNAVARLLHADPGSIDDHSALLRERNTSLDLSKEDRTIQPLNRHLTAGATAVVPDTCPCPTQHVDFDQHLITQYLKRTSQPAVGTAPQRCGPGRRRCTCTARRGWGRTVSKAPMQQRPPQTAGPTGQDERGQHHSWRVQGKQAT